MMCGWGTYLSHESFSYGFIVLGAEGLLEEGEEDGDDDAGLEAFSEADEEDWVGVNVAQLQEGEWI